MRTDFPSTGQWIDQTATRCAHRLGLFSEEEIALLREVLTEALSEFPQSALNNDVLTDLYGELARERHDSMSPEAWVHWRHALQLHRQLGAGRRGLCDSGELEKAWRAASQAWFEVASGTTLNQPVRLESEGTRPRDMLVTRVEVMCDSQDITGYAVLTARVYRPPRTSDCQLYFPGARLCRLEWSDLPTQALQDRVAGGG